MHYLLSVVCRAPGLTHPFFLSCCCFAVNGTATCPPDLDIIPCRLSASVRGRQKTGRSERWARLFANLPAVRASPESRGLLGSFVLRAVFLFFTRVEKQNTAKGFPT